MYFVLKGQQFICIFILQLILFTGSIHADCDASGVNNVTIIIIKSLQYVYVTILRPGRICALETLFMYKVRSNLRVLIPKVLESNLISMKVLNYRKLNDVNPCLLVCTYTETACYRRL